MKYLLLLMLTSCQMYRVVTPQEAILVCQGDVKKVEVMIGRITCKGGE